MPSASTIMPNPPETARIFNSKSSSSSRSAEKFSGRIAVLVGAEGSKSVCCGIVRFGPGGKLQTAAALNAIGGNVEQAPHPLFDMRPTLGVELPGGGSNTPTEVL